jgi:ornithine cyclodeaminase
MQVMTNEAIASVLTVADSIAVMRKAFASYAKAGAMQERVRIDCGSTKLSMMGAILPGLDAVGAKVYTTINGRFTFLIVLFSAIDGRLLAVMEGDAMTEYRTAAVTAIAADAFASPQARTLAIFGTGVQARAHVPALLAVRPFSEILVAGIEGTEEFARSVTSRFDIPCETVPAAEAAARADVIVTATRSPAPLFSGKDVKPDAFVAAIGSSKPDAREVDELLVRRASKIVVEWKQQAQREAGDLMLCEEGAFDWTQVSELSQALGTPGLQNRSSGIVLYKAIGVAMEDVALAEFVYRKLSP